MTDTPSPLHENLKALRLERGTAPAPRSWRRWVVGGIVVLALVVGLVVRMKGGAPVPVETAVIVPVAAVCADGSV